MISIIVAYDENYGIGLNNKLPWKLADDLKYFKKTTLNNTIIMGRKTFDSIGKALPNRHNIILTHNESLQIQDCEMFNDVTSLLTVLKKGSENFVIGGENIFKLLLPYTQRMYITRVHTKIKADTFFPKWDKNNWQLIDSKKYLKDSNNDYDFTFEIWDKLKNQSSKY